MNSNMNRRTFVSGLTAGTVGLAVAPTIIAGGKTKKSKSDKIMRIGIIGGRFGARSGARRRTARHAGQPGHLERAHAALRADVELPDRFDLIAEKLDADRIDVARRKDVEDPAARRKVAR